MTSITPCAAFAPYTAEAASVATVNSSGLVTGVASGSATITVTTQDGGRTTTSAITVNSASQTPFGGTPWAVPGTIEAENFDNGGEGVAYHDNDAVNSGGQGRAGEGGLNVGWTNTGEWLEYTVNVTAAGTYNIDVRTASTLAGGTFRIEFGGVDKNRNDDNRLYGTVPSTTSRTLQLSEVWC